MRIVRINDPLEPQGDLSQQRRRNSKRGHSREYGEILSSLLDMSVPIEVIEENPVKQKMPPVSPVPHFQITLFESL